MLRAAHSAPARFVSDFERSAKIIMKRIIITLGLALVFAHASRAEPENYGRYWKDLPEAARNTYVIGFRDGGSNAFLVASIEWLPPEESLTTAGSPRRERVRKKTMTMFTSDILVPVMNEIYKDPANAFIGFKEVLFLARDKLLGEDVNSAIIEARKKAIRDQEYIKPKE